MSYTTAKPQPGSPATARTLNKVCSEALLSRGRELVITHNGREYRLRLTRSGKLILTA